MWGLGAAAVAWVPSLTGLACLQCCSALCCLHSTAGAGAGGAGHCRDINLTVWPLARCPWSGLMVADRRPSCMLCVPWVPPHTHSALCWLPAEVRVVPCCRAADVIELKAPAGKTFSYGELKAAVEQHKPTALFVVQVRLCAGRAA